MIKGHVQITVLIQTHVYPCFHFVHDCLWVGQHLFEMILYFCARQFGTASLYVCASSRTICCMFFVCVQNDRYTVGGSETFDTLTDLVEYYKRKGIEEMSGNWVFFKQVNLAFSHVRICNVSE